MEASNASYIDVDSTNFEQVVIQGSKEKVVVVDFWAEWCGPCKTLGPILEDVVTALGPGIVLAKVDVDANQELAQAFRVQSIPSVKVVKGGQIVDEFTGAVAREQLEERLRQHVPDAPDGAIEETADLVDAARVQLEMGDVDSAERLYDEALRENADNGAAILGLARLRLLQNAEEGVIRELVGRIEEGSSEWEQGKALLTHLEFRGSCESAGGAQACAARLESAPEDSEARYLVGCCAAVEGDYETALRQWFTIVETDRGFREGAAKDAMVSVFHLLGRQHPAVDDYPQRLYRTLY
jgi:putative thioredoxin